MRPSHWHFAVSLVHDLDVVGVEEPNDGVVRAELLADDGAELLVLLQPTVVDAVKVILLQTKIDFIFQAERNLSGSFFLTYFGYEVMR